MKKAKSVVNKIKGIQQKVKSIEGKINKGVQFAEHPLKSLGGTVGSKLGSRKVGEGVGAFLGRFSGTGDYTVQQNTFARTPFSGSTVPQFIKSGRGTRVIHREYLGDVVASSVAGAFKNTVYPVNPGLFESFPWLCAFASQFDEWVPNGIVAVYNPLSSFYSGTTSLGTVILASDYDVTDSPYTSKIEMENSEFACSANAATGIMHPIECAVNERPMRVLYTRSGGQTTDNLRFYDLCNLQVATVGCTSNQVCGELWLSFDITFYKTQIYGGISGKGILFADYNLTGGTGPTWFTSAVLSSSSNIRDLVLTSGVGPNTITFPPKYTGGTFLIILQVLGGAGATTSAITLSGGFVQAPNDVLGQVNLTTSTTYLIVYGVTLNADPLGGTISFADNVWPSTPDYANLSIRQINPSQTTLS